MNMSPKLLNFLLVAIVVVAVSVTVWAAARCLIAAISVAVVWAVVAFTWNLKKGSRSTT